MVVLKSTKTDTTTYQNLKSILHLCIVCFQICMSTFILTYVIYAFNISKPIVNINFNVILIKAFIKSYMHYFDNIHVFQYVTPNYVF